MICSCSPGRVPGPFAAGGAGREPRPLYSRGEEMGNARPLVRGGSAQPRRGASPASRRDARRHATRGKDLQPPKTPALTPAPARKTGPWPQLPSGGGGGPARSAPLPPAARPAPSPPGVSAEPGRCSPGSRASRRPAGLLRGTTIPRPPCSSAGRLEGAGLSIRERQRGERAGDPPRPPALLRSR